MTENKRFTLHKGLDTLNIMDNTKFNEQIYINKSHKDMKLLVGLLNRLAEENNELKDKLKNGLCPLCGARVSKCGGLQKYKGDFE